MNQVTHTWLAIRAIGLLEDAKEDNQLIELLMTKVNKISLGAWMPDLTDAKIGSGDIDNHVLKMMPLETPNPYFVVAKKELLKILGNERMIHTYLENDKTLGENWWNKAYKADPSPGQHLGNRANALCIAITDLLLLGDDNLSKLVPGEVNFHNDLDASVQTKTEQVGLYFFMLSHFIADSCMPMHCDARKLNGFKMKLHHEWEQHWSDKLPALFNKDEILKSNLTNNEIILAAKKCDSNFNIQFNNVIPEIDKNNDVWKEIIMVCRGSYALSCIVNPLTEPFDIDQKGKSFADLYNTKDGKNLIETIDAIVIHDAVLSIAMIWKHIWSKFEKRK